MYYQILTLQGAWSVLTTIYFEGGIFAQVIEGNKNFQSLQISNMKIHVTLCWLFQFLEKMAKTINAKKSRYCVILPKKKKQNIFKKPKENDI